MEAASRIMEGVDGGELLLLLFDVGLVGAALLLPLVVEAPYELQLLVGLGDRGFLAGRLDGGEVLLGLLHGQRGS